MHGGDLETLSKYSLHVVNVIFRQCSPPCVFSHLQLTTIGLSLVEMFHFCTFPISSIRIGPDCETLESDGHETHWKCFMGLVSPS